MAGLDAEQLDFQRRITRLAGLSEAELQTLATDAEEFTGDTLGEIDRLQIERRQAVNWRAIESTVFLILIPIIALLAILFARRAGRKLVDRMVRLDDKNASDREKAERELRATTLMDIFGTIWNIIIIGLAVIYMLKVVNIDVTPILASLGIFGLAVAFGAQAIMKDLFTGFFLLLENQMNRGDWVTVNGALGQVESIGLRVTKVRDFKWGSLHYIPNGQISTVESWSRGLGKECIMVSVPLSEDHARVRKLIVDLIAKMQADPRHGHKLGKSYVEEGIKSFDTMTGAMSFEAWLVFTEDYWEAGGIFRQSLKEILEAEGIPFAIPQQQIHMGPPSGDTARPHQEDLVTATAD
jgi:small conductance mechanosensitive channel